MPLAAPRRRRAICAPQAALKASDDALRDWVPPNSAITDVNTHLRNLQRGPRRWGGGPRPSALDARYVWRGARCAAPAPVVTGSLAAQCWQITWTASPHGRADPYAAWRIQLLAL